MDGREEGERDWQGSGAGGKGGDRMQKGRNEEEKDEEEGCWNDGEEEDDEEG